MKSAGYPATASSPGFNRRTPARLTPSLGAARFADGFCRSRRIVCGILFGGLVVEAS
jgi:hypothetical protein